jgi:hypothetical protein
LRVEIFQENGCNHVVFSSESTQNPPYKVINDTPYDFFFYQLETRSFHNQLLPSFQEKSFTWEQPTKPKKLCIEFPLTVAGKKISPCFEFGIDAVDFQKKFKLESGHEIYFFIRPVNQTKVVYVSEKSGKFWQEFKEDEENNSKKDAKIIEEIADFEFQLNIEGLGISVVDSTPKELIYFWLKGVLVSFSQSEINQNIQVRIEDLQVNIFIILFLFHVFF